MANRYTPTQKLKLAEFLHVARKGDRILNTIISNLVSTYGGSNGGLNLALRSNEIIAMFSVPAKFHNLPKRKSNNKNALGMKGDVVEAYVWFLHTNYGYRAAERYVIKNLKNVADEI